MAILYVTDGAWGTGTGAPLSAAQVDGNFHDHEQRIVALETAGVPEANGIKDITSDGTSLTVILDDDTELGPFVMPTPQLRFVQWANDTDYSAGTDFVIVDGFGVFKVLQDVHTPTVPTAFDPDATSGGNPIYQQIYGTPQALQYDIEIQVLGALPGNGAVIAQHICVRAMRLPLNLDGSLAYLRTPADAALTIVLMKNATEIGTIDFAAGENFGAFTFSAAVDFAIADLLTVLADVDDADATAANLTLAFIAQRI